MIFSNDGANTMLVSHGRVATRLKNKLGQMKLIFAKLKQFKYINILYSLADILHSLALLL